MYKNLNSFRICNLQVFVYDFKIGWTRTHKEAKSLDQLYQMNSLTHFCSAGDFESLDKHHDYTECYFVKLLSRVLQIHFLHFQVKSFTTNLDNLNQV